MATYPSWLMLLGVGEKMSASMLPREIPSGFLGVLLCQAISGYSGNLKLIVIWSSALRQVKRVRQAKI